MCVCHLSDNSPSSHWLFPTPPICTVPGIKTFISGGEKEAKKLPRNRPRDTAQRLVCNPFTAGCPALHKLEAEVRASHQGLELGVGDLSAEKTV